MHIVQEIAFHLFKIVNNFVAKLFKYSFTDNKRQL